MQAIETKHGMIELAKIDNDLFRRVRKLFPYGIVGMKSVGSEEMGYGLVMQCGDSEVFGIKLQPVDCDREQAETAMKANTILVTEAIPRYIQSQYEGALIPFPYLREKGDAYESGIALFIFPDLNGPEAHEDISFASGFDNQFGKGCTAMLSAFVRALQASSKDIGISLYPVIGMEPRPRLQLGSLSFGYLIVGNNIVAIKNTITDKDFSWGVLCRAGVNRIALMPSRPAGINPSDLAVAKPES